MMHVIKIFIFIVAGIMPFRSAADMLADEPDSNRIVDEPQDSNTQDPFVIERKKKADEYFKRGVLLYEGGDYAKAAEAFRVAYDTFPHPAVLGNIATCYDKAGKIPEAVSFYRRYLQEPVDSHVNDSMNKRLNELSGLVAELAIKCNLSCEIRVNGIVRGESEASVLLMPGKHRVEGAVKGTVLSSEMISLDAQEVKNLVLELKELNQLKPNPEYKPQILLVPRVPSVDAPSRMTPGGGFWFSTGMTVASLSIVTAFGSMTLSQKGEYQASGWTDSDSKERGERYRTVTNAMIGMSGASAFAALLFAITDIRSHKKKKRTLVSASLKTGVAVEVSF